MKLEKRKPYLYHISFDTQDDMANAFIRFHAIQDCPEFESKIFTEKEFRNWYKKSHNDIDSFNEDWSGFNTPSTVLKIFIDGQMNPLSQAEQQVIDLCKDIKDDYCLIASFSTYEYNYETIPHEIAHALFLFEPEYKKEVMDVMLECEEIHTLLNFIKQRWGYSKSVAWDETQAFLLTNKIMLEQEAFDTKPFEETMIKIKDIFDKYK